MIGMRRICFVPQRKMQATEEKEGIVGLNRAGRKREREMKRVRKRQKKKNRVRKREREKGK